MKNHFLFLKLVLGILLTLISNAIFAASCDYIETNTVRYGASRQFFDTFTNPNNTAVASLQNWSVDLGTPSYSGFVTGGGDFRYVGPVSLDILPGKTEEILNIPFGATISSHPITRSLVGDFTIKYTLDYNFGLNTPINSHIECANYIITWCGDGVIDSSDGETCDPADTLKTGWGTNGCSTVCQPLEGGPSLKIKKYAKSIANGDSQSAPVAIGRGETFNYYYTLENESTATAAAKNVIVKDTFPADLSYAGNIVVRDPSGKDVTSDWICTKGTYQATPRITLSCEKKTDLPANSGVYVFTIPVTLSATATLGTSMQNVAYICADNAPSNPTGPGGAIVCGNTNPPPPPPIGQCDPLNPNSQKDPACIKVTPSIPASCDSLTVNPSTGVAPLDVAVSCSATSAVKYLIDCGNSTSITTPTGTCRYPVVGTYTAKCTINDTISSVACTKIVTPSAAPVFSEVVIKKYAKEITALGDSQTIPVKLQPGEVFNYYYQVQNISANPALDVMVKDTLPPYLTFTGSITIRNPSNADVTNDWMLATGSTVFPGETFPRITFVGKKRTNLPANSGIYTFIIPVVLSQNVPTGIDLHNVAYVCASNDPTNPALCANDTPPPPPPPRCDSIVPGAQFDPACIQVVGQFDLSVKKYVKGDDIFAPIASSEDYNYNIIVTNNGTGSSTGTTTVRDILPAPITLQPGLVPTGNGWTCVRAGDRDFTCTTTASVTANQVYNTITIPARVTGIAYRPSAYTNVAYVSNPYEVIGKRCRTDGSIPDPALAGANGENPALVCNEDIRNSDAATVNPPNPAGFDLGLTKFVNGNDDSARANADGSINYTFLVHNYGVLASSGKTTVRDIDFPVGVTPLTITASQSGWTCTNITGGFECFRADILAAGQDYPLITLVAKLEATAPVGTLRNVACLSNPYDPDEGAPYNPNLGQYKKNNCNPANVVVPPPGTFDLTIVKKVGNNLTDGSLKDRNTALEGNGEQNILIIGAGAPLVYTYDIRNLGTVIATGTTTVEDTLPAWITISGSVANQVGWTCTSGANGNRSWSCSRTENLAVGASFPTITVFARSDAAILAGIYSNIATVRNPGDSNPNNNTDPANVKVVLQSTCGVLIANPATNPNTPNTPITYTCSAAGYTGLPANLEYDIVCGGGSLGWSGSSSRICALPGTSSTAFTTTCRIQDKTLSGTIFTGSAVGACVSTLTTTGGGGGGGGVAYYGKKCVNGVPNGTCAGYNSLVSCELDVGVGRCYPGDSVGFNICSNQVLACGGGTGGGGPYCGDGVIQPAGADGRIGTIDDEECDIRGGNNATSSCSANCKVNAITTYPGANPLSAMWITIPKLTNVRLGYAWVNQIPFKENRMIVGEGTPLFTVADTVGFGLKTDLQMPMIIRADKEIFLSSDGNGLTSNEIRTQFGTYANKDGYTHTIERICGTNYIIMGLGQYQIPDGVDCTPPLTYVNKDAKYSNNITLFKGSARYLDQRGNSITLASAFLGKLKNQGGTLTLSNGSRSDIAHYIPLVWFDVKVSGSLVGGSAGTVNRGIERYTHASNLVDAFLVGIRGNTTTTTNTNTASMQPVARIDVQTNPNGRGSLSVSTPGGLETLAVNGNKNILSVKGGDLTISSCGPNNTLELTGVRTVIVEGGDLIIRCNLIYPPYDSSSSWAFIVKGGNIQIYPGTTVPAEFGVTNLAGVYVTIPDGGRGGQFMSSHGATQKILKVDGSFYGDAKPLFDSRLYVRGTTAYENLTTGVILSYSNRPLVSPPPLLSQYLNNYSVMRVVK